MQEKNIEISIEQLRELNIEITSLNLRVITSDEQYAGTNADVYFDIGSFAWKLNKIWVDDFEQGDDDTYKLSLRKLIAMGITLTTKDIIWLRLHIKGMFGINGLGQGFLGNWKPEKLELIINDTCIYPVIINSWLGDEGFYSSVNFKATALPIFKNDDKQINREENKISDAWVQVITPLPAEHLFAESLRITPNNPLEDLAKDLAFITTPLFKEQGISGWKETPFPVLELIGRNMRAAGRSNDSFATIDIELLFVRVNNYFFKIENDSINESNNKDKFEKIRGKIDAMLAAEASNNKPLQEIRISHKRYIRAEYKFQETKEAKKKIPVKGEFIFIRGKLKWDTDFEGWYEIHPFSQDDITIF